MCAYPKHLVALTEARLAMRCLLPAKKQDILTSKGLLSKGKFEHIPQPCTSSISGSFQYELPGDKPGFASLSCLSSGPQACRLGLQSSGRAPRSLPGAAGLSSWPQRHSLCDKQVLLGWSRPSISANVHRQLPHVVWLETAYVDTRDRPSNYT